MNAKSSVVAFAVTAVFTLAASPAAAAVSPGDVVTGSFGPPAGIAVFGDLGVIHLDGSYTQMRTYLDNGVTTVGVSPAGLIYAGESAFPSPRLVVFDTNGSTVGVLSPGWFYDVAFDRGGYIYAAGGRVLKLSPTGQLVATFAPAALGVQPAIIGIDLAADQCTLFYTTSSGTIQRFDVCRGIQLADFVSIPAEHLKPIRVLLDGSIVVGGRSAVYRVAGSGQIVQQYQPFGGSSQTSSYLGIAVGQDAQSIWIARGASVIRVNLQSGATIQGPLGGPVTEIEAIAVMGEPRAATAPAIPAFSALGAFVLLAALVAIAWARL